MKSTGVRGAGKLRYGLMIAMIGMLMGVVASAAPVSVSAQGEYDPATFCGSDGVTTFAYKFEDETLFNGSTDGIVTASFTFDEDGDPTSVVLTTADGYVITLVSLKAATNSYSFPYPGSDPLSPPEKYAISHVIVCYEVVDNGPLGCTIGFWSSNLEKRNGDAWPTEDSKELYGEDIFKRGKGGLTAQAQEAAAQLNKLAFGDYFYPGDDDDSNCPLTMSGK